MRQKIKNKRAIQLLFLFLRKIYRYYRPTPTTPSVLITRYERNAMSAYLPQGLPENELHVQLTGAGLVRIHQGKVRDTYSLPDHPDLLLQVATDRISIFDFVLNAQVPFKGEVLTAMTVFWLTSVLHNHPHHLFAHGISIDKFLPHDLSDNLELQKRGLVVCKLEMYKIELIVRGYLTGSGWQNYQQTGKVYGIDMPPNLYDGSQLPNAIFTPTTKAETGHDKPIDPAMVHPRVAGLVRKIYAEATAYAELCGIIIADTKFETDFNGTLADEVLTPDSSRFWLKHEWEAAQREKRAPSGYDKELVRKWGKQVSIPPLSSEEETEKHFGIHHLDPDNPNHRAFVHELVVPADLLQQTSSRYLEIFGLLTDQELREFQREMMDLPT